MTEHLIERHHIAPGSSDDAGFQKFHDPPSEPGRTLDRVGGPDVDLRLELAEGHDLQLPYALAGGARQIRMWSIKGAGAPTEYPSALIRVRQDELVNARIITSKGPHTIHWHGIEPSPMNDGVGKHSFEVRQEYTYQWTPRSAGLYFYHCHRNTPLHFEMGLFGGLIVDPPEGEGWVAAYAPPHHVAPYDVEAVWVVGAHDSRWHLLDNHAHGLMTDRDPNSPASFTADGILNDWRPDVLALSGAVAQDAATPITDPRAAVRAEVGQTVLLRILNASYAIAECRLGADATIIAQDGRPYGVPPYGAYSMPVTVRKGTPFRLNTAMRHDILLRPTEPGVIPFEVDYLDWRGYGSHGKLRTTITVTGEPVKPPPDADDDSPKNPSPPGAPAQGAPTTTTPGSATAPKPTPKPGLSLRERRRRARLAERRRLAALRRRRARAAARRLRGR